MTKDRLKKLWTGLQAWARSANGLIAVPIVPEFNLPLDDGLSQFLPATPPERAVFRADLDRLSGARPGSLITVAPNPRCEYCGGRPGAKERCGNCGAPNAFR